MAPEKLATFNVGGKRYEVSRSLLESHKDSMLYTSSKEVWQEDQSSEIFLERDGERFRYCLDYLRDGRVNIPFTVSKEALIADLEYFGVDFSKETIVPELANMTIMEMCSFKKQCANACEYYSSCRVLAEKFMRKYEETGKLRVYVSKEVTLGPAKLHWKALGMNQNSAYFALEESDIPIANTVFLADFGLKCEAWSETSYRPSIIELSF